MRTNTVRERRIQSTVYRTQTLNCKFNPYYIWMCQHFRTVNTHIVNFIERIVWVGWFGSVLFVSVVKQSREVGAKSLCAAQRLYFMHRKWEVRLCGLCRPHAKRSSLEQRFLISFICTGGTQKDVPSSRPAPLTGPLGGVTVIANWWCAAGKWNIRMTAKWRSGRGQSNSIAVTHSASNQHLIVVLARHFMTFMLLHTQIFFEGKYNISCFRAGAFAFGGCGGQVGRGRRGIICIS